MSYYWEANVSASRTRIVLCEECETEFVYELKVTGTGDTSWAMSWSANKEDAAVKKAKKDLKEKLKYSCRAIPCPECAHVQKHMISQAKYDLAEPGYIAAGCIGFLGLIGLAIGKFAGSESQAVTIGFVLLGVAVVIAGISWAVSQAYNPNSVSKDKRYKKADDNSHRRDEFEERVAKVNRKDFDKAFNGLAKKHKNGKSTVFPVFFWADKDQVLEGVNKKVELPTDEIVRIRLSEDMRDGDEFEISRTVDDVPVFFVCTMNVYTETRVKK